MKALACLLIAFSFASCARPPAWILTGGERPWLYVCPGGVVWSDDRPFPPSLGCIRPNGVVFVTVPLANVRDSSVFDGMRR